MTEQVRGSVLVVEDDAELRFILSAQLRAHGFDVLEADDGQAGVDCARETLPDLIIMDLSMPRMDGITAIETLRADGRTAEIPVIILTAKSSSSDVVRGLNAGAQEYLHKPFDVAELTARVRTVHRLAMARRRIDRLNTQLEAQVDQTARRIQCLFEYMRDLNRAKTVESVIDLLDGAARQSTGSTQVAVFLVGSERGQLRCACHRGVDEPTLAALKREAANLVAGHVFREGATLASGAIGSRDSQGDPASGFLTTPLMCMCADDEVEVVGVLQVGDETSGRFSDEDVECLRSIADGAAIALENIRRQMRLEQSVRVLLQTVGHLAEYRDEETTRHLERVAKTANVLALELQQSSPYAAEITSEFVESIALAAPLHDIGKVGIPDDILTKPGKLSDEEYAVMKTHADIGHRVLSRAIDPTRPVPLLQMCVDIAHCHHERYDGTGYPQRLAGEQIPLAARIVALVDAYDAITSKRRYKEPSSHETAVELITADSGKHFDPVIVEGFLRCQDQFDAIRSRYGEVDELVGAGA